MKNLSNELLLEIFRRCDFPTIISLRQTCRLYSELIDHVFKNWKHFSFSGAFTKKKRVIHFQEMFKIISKMTSLHGITLEDVPYEITPINIRTIGSTFSNLRRLELIQNKQHFSEETIRSLNYIENLEHLKLSHIFDSRDYDNNRLNMIPNSTLEKLVSLEILCEGAEVAKLLKHIITNNVKMHKIEFVSFEIKHSTRDIPEYTLKFIERHPQLKTISFNGFLFTTQDQVRLLYDHLLTLPRLETLHLMNCSVIDRIENTIQKKFLESLNRRGIRFNSIVNSLRHL